MTSPPSAASPSSPRGFTLVELMAVLGIVMLLMGILVAVIARTRTSAALANARNSLQIISQALDQYAHDFRGLYPMSRDDRGEPQPGVRLLARALIAPGPASEDGLDGPGFRTMIGGSAHKPYLDPGRFKPVLINGQWEILDTFDTPYAYLPRRKPAIQPAAGPLVGPGGIFDPADIRGLEDKLGPVDARIDDICACLRSALGDANGNNRIDPGESLRNTGKFILISAGPQGIFFSDPGRINKNDNLYNFER